MMSPRFVPRRLQCGAYLLEALIGILIFAFGVLGIVGLQAASLRTTSDSSLRAEAIFAANQLMGLMWSDAEGTLSGNYSSNPAGAAYTNWATQLQSVQGGAWVQNPTVDFGAGATANCNASPSVVQGVATTSVWIVIYWQPQNQAQNNGVPHQYATCGMIGQNVP